MIQRTCINSPLSCEKCGCADTVIHTAKLAVLWSCYVMCGWCKSPCSWKRHFVYSHCQRAQSVHTEVAWGVCIKRCVFCVLPARRSTNKRICWEQVFCGSHRTCPFFPNLKCLGLSCTVIECCWTCWQIVTHTLFIVSYSAEWILCSLRWYELPAAPQRHRIAVYFLHLVKC